MDGWIKIYRAITEWEWYQNSQMVHLLIHLIFKANIMDKKWKGITIKRGQLVTSVASLSSSTGISIRSIRTCLDRMEETGEIDKETTNKFTIITICKYDSYQDCEISNDNQTTIKRQSNDNQTTTTKEYKKEIIKKESNIKAIAFTSTEPVDDHKNQDVVDLSQMKTFFNEKMEDREIPKIAAMSKRRIAYVNARCREYGKNSIAIVVEKAAMSDFLNGSGNKGFIANFDWIFRPNNFPKILEGNYDNTKQANGNTTINTIGSIPTERERRMQQSTTDLADFIRKVDSKHSGT